MSETTAMVLVAAITAPGSVIRARIAWLAHKGVNYLDEEVKAKNADTKLTKEEAAETSRRTVDQSLDLLTREGMEVGKDVLGVVVEAVVGKLKVENNGSRGEVKAAA